MTKFQVTITDIIRAFTVKQQSLRGSWLHLVPDSTTAFLKMVRKSQFTASSSCAVFTLLLHSGHIKRQQTESKHTSYFLCYFCVQLMPESSVPYALKSGSVYTSVVAMQQTSGCFYLLLKMFASVFF